MEDLDAQPRAAGSDVDVRTRRDPGRAAAVVNVVTAVGEGGWD
jgi:hypothetical protein